MEIKPNITLITGLIVAVIACQDAIDPELQQINREFVGRAGETVISENQKNSDLPFVLQIVSIQESRCPSNVTCIRFGEVVVSTQLKFLDQSQFTDYNFCLGDCPQPGDDPVITDTLDVFHNDATYRIILKEVVPFPEEPEAELMQTAVFNIMQL